ncbi:MAG: GTP-binding protein [Candidatus Odinarchaeia archaeon]
MSRYRKNLSKILQIMKCTDAIRNVGIVAHIDHGKTTLTDSLLSASGYLSSELAGTLRALDYLEEEQKRGITIKAANISLFYEDEKNDPYLINLVDTPGHVDFTGNVTRSLRMIDGVVVVVDAVEEVMVQTETVTRQALSEYIRPILFINKIDRLINELRLSELEIQKKLQRIIIEFNGLIETYCPEEFIKKWKVNSKNSSVSFGSAIDKWGFNYNILSTNNLKFNFILKKYQQGKQEELQQIIPVHIPIFQGMIEQLPSPVEAQKYRIKKIWLGDSDLGGILSQCDPKSPLTMFVSKIDYDPKTKYTATARIFSGTVNRGKKVTLLTNNSQQIIKQLFLLMGPYHEQIEDAPAGNIVAIGGLESVREGETIVESGLETRFLPFEKISYFTEPVLTISIEPVKFSQLEEFIDKLKILTIQDSTLKITINSETGEYLLSGIGELHLEIAVKKLKESGIDIVTSKPMVVYRESVSKIASLKKTSSTVKELEMLIAPLPSEIVQFLEGKPVEDKSIKKIVREINRRFNYTKQYGNVLYIFNNENILVASNDIELPDKIIEVFIQTLSEKLKSGILCEEPVKGVMIVIKKFDANTPNINLIELTSMINELFDELFENASSILLEPIFKIQITAPNELVGKIVNIINQRKGKIKDVKENKHNTIITGSLPVRNSFGLSVELRKKTSGRAFWQTQFDNWTPLEGDAKIEVLNAVRKRKGLPAVK